MTKKTDQQLYNDVLSDFATNGTGQITATHFRTFFKDLLDSIVFKGAITEGWSYQDYDNFRKSIRAFPISGSSKLSLLVNAMQVLKSTQVHGDDEYGESAIFSGDGETSVFEWRVANDDGRYNRKVTPPTVSNSGAYSIEETVSDPFATVYKLLNLDKTKFEVYLNERADPNLKLSTSGIGIQGDCIITGSYTPFTGSHLATSGEKLKVGELVSLSSKKLDGKQPIWEADYCTNAQKGIFGVVYDIVYKKELYTVEKEGKVVDKKGVEKTKKINVTKERNTNIIEYYLIAAVGDAVVNFSNENGECEVGDYLIPSTTKKGCVMVSKENFIPLNHCGKAGEACSENRLIAWVKE